jgi:hypothetical protein
MGSIPNGIIEIFHCLNTSSSISALQLTEPPTKMSASRKGVGA